MKNITVSVDDETYRRDLGAKLLESSNGKIVDSDWNWLAERMSYVQGEFDDPAAKLNAMIRINPPSRVRLGPSQDETVLVTSMAMPIDRM